MLCYAYEGRILLQDKTKYKWIIKVYNSNETDYNLGKKILYSIQILKMASADDVVMSATTKAKCHDQKHYFWLS